MLRHPGAAPRLIASSDRVPAIGCPRSEPPTGPGPPGRAPGLFAPISRLPAISTPPVGGAGIGGPGQAPRRGGGHWPVLSSGHATRPGQADGRSWEPIGCRLAASPSTHVDLAGKRGSSCAPAPAAAPAASTRARRPAPAPTARPRPALQHPRPPPSPRDPPRRSSGPPLPPRSQFGTNPRSSRSTARIAASSAGSA